MSSIPAEEGDMRHTAAKLFLTVMLSSLFLVPVSARADFMLPDYMKIDIKRLEETWNILDQFAERIWPGWDNYRDIPFKYTYPNGMELLVGHDDPPDTFELVEGFEVQGKKVYVDRTREIALELKPPLGGGGGILTWGKTKPVPIVDLKMSESRRKLESRDKEPKEDTEGRKRDLPDEYILSSEQQILINIHELFHCYQRKVYHYRFGNYSANPDANMAIYAEIEGQALERAFLEKSDEEAIEYLKDFIVARELKRKDLFEIERNQESEDDLMEGTAVYSETMALNLIREGYTPAINKEDDPNFLGFKYVDDLIEDKIDYLREQSRNVLDCRGKCYPYGCFQALMLSRLFPDWQENFFQDKKLLDLALAEKLAVSDAKKGMVIERLKTRYDYGEIVRRNTERIEQRNDALDLIQKRKGRVYIINFKPTHEYLTPKWRGESYKVGLMNIAPRGLESMEMRDIVLEGKEIPILQDQLFYIKWVDTETPPHEKGYTIEFSRKEGENVYYDAVFRTKGFVLKAPKIQLKDRPARVKVTVLSKINT